MRHESWLLGARIHPPALGDTIASSASPSPRPAAETLCEEGLIPLKQTARPAYLVFIANALPRGTSTGRHFA